MILADKIIDLRKKNGWSQEELAEQLGVSRQSVSKWESAQSVPDMARIVQMSELFGVSTDYLLKDTMDIPNAVDSSHDSETGARTVSLEEANAFLAVKETNARTVALGVMLCILSPIAVILLSVAQELGMISLSDGQAVGLGIGILLLMVGGAVALFVTSGLRGSRFEYLEKENIDTLYGVDGMVKERREAFKPTYARQLTIGIVLCVLSAVPIFLSLLFRGEDDEFAMVLAVSALLALVAVGVMLIVHACTPWGAFQRLLEEGDYSREAKARTKKMGPFSQVYWGLVTAGFLAWSFITNAWDRTWIIWPVAAVAFGAIYGIAGALRRRDG